MNVILQVIVVLHGITFSANLSKWEKLDLCQQVAKLGSGENWDLTCHYEGLVLGATASTAIYPSTGTTGTTMYPSTGTTIYPSTLECTTYSPYTYSCTYH